MKRDTERDPAVLLRLSAQAQEAGDGALALAYARRAARASRDLPDLHHAAGRALSRLSQWPLAQRCFERVIELMPSSADGYLGLARVFLAQDQIAAAAPLFHRVLAVSPTNGAAYQGLAMCLVRNAPLDAILRYLREAPDAAANRPLAYLSVADSLMFDGRHLDAQVCCQELLQLEPRLAKVHALLAEIAFILGDADGALERATAAAQLAPDDPGIVSARLRMLASFGNFSEAREVYLAAGDVMSRVHSYRFTPWRGEPLAGKTLFMRTARGNGDALQFARYAQIARRLGASVVVQSSAALTPVLRTVAGIDRLILPLEDPGHVDYESDFELFGLVAGITLREAGSYVPYASVPETSASVGADLGDGDGVRIVLAWDGQIEFPLDPYRRRGVPLAELRPVFDMPGVTTISVQKGDGALQIARVAGSRSFVEAGSACRTYGDTAAYLSRADVVICSDCSVAHLAGALGRPTWILLPFAANWRWCGHADRSDWYPTARLFRQQRPGVWSDPIAEVASGLGRLVASRAPQISVASATVSTME